MSDKIIRVTPDQLGYQDRGKMKWMGLMISHHLDLLREIDERDKIKPPISKEKMTEIDISASLQVGILRDNKHFTIHSIYFFRFQYQKNKITKKTTSINIDSLITDTPGISLLTNSF